MAEITDFDPTDANNTGRWPENMAFSAVNDAGRADEGILARWFRDWNGSIVASGSSNAYAITSNRTIASLVNNTLMWFRANHTNTGAATLNLNSLGAKDIVRATGSALTAGDITSGQIVGVYYNSTLDDWVLITPAAQGTASESATGLIELATAAEVLALDSSRAVRGSTMASHPGMPRAFGSVQDDGTLEAGSYNVDSAAKDTTGTYTVTLDVTMGSAVYAVVVTAEGPGSAARIINITARTTTTFTVEIRTVSNNLSDQDFCFAVFGPLA